MSRENRTRRGIGSLSLVELMMSIDCIVRSVTTKRHRQSSIVGIYYVLTACLSGLSGRQSVIIRLSAVLNVEIHLVCRRFKPLISSTWSSSLTIFSLSMID